MVVVLRAPTTSTADDQPSRVGVVPVGVFAAETRLWPPFLHLGVSLARQIALWWFVLPLPCNDALSAIGAKLTGGFVWTMI